MVISLNILLLFWFCVGYIVALVCYFQNKVYRVISLNAIHYRVYRGCWCRSVLDWGIVLKLVSDFITWIMLLNSLFVNAYFRIWWTCLCYYLLIWMKGCLILVQFIFRTHCCLRVSVCIDDTAFTVSCCVTTQYEQYYRRNIIVSLIGVK